MSGSPKVSVGVVTYNQEKYIEQTVTSILDQDYENLEVIVSDDASADSTQDILTKLHELYPGRLKIIFQQKNIGLAQNCQAVLDACSGEYVCLTGGDDLYIQGKVRKQVEFMQSHPEYLLSYHQVEAFVSKTGQHWYYFTEKIIEGSAEELIENGMEFLPLSVMFVNTRKWPTFRTEAPIASDWLFCIEYLIKNSGNFGFMPGIYASYRRHESNITNVSDNSDNWTAISIMRNEYPQYQRAVERFRSRLTLTEFRAGRLTLVPLLLRFLTSPFSFVWAFFWLFETRLRRRKAPSTQPKGITI
ncbi:glycosyltransferase family 2 protein [Deinococcus arcticus]|uniref:glycosyltransferase family 2 protein n=1 Tax=Deinococcus arcticus TaxID=2136176 RepID=UPI001304F65D|nr:glycosyltransferase [Deinococcus arcticus]